MNFLEIAVDGIGGNAANSISGHARSDNPNSKYEGGDDIFIDYDLPIDNTAFTCVEPWSEDCARRNEFLEQAAQAFSTEPSMSSVIHGRRVIKLGKRGTSRSSYFPSKKNAMGSLSSVYLPMDSRLEAAFAVKLERNPNFRAYRTQAIELDVPGGKVFPDFLVVNYSGLLHVVDVKADKRYLSRKMKQRIDHLTEMLGRWGVEYSVVDSFDLPQGTELKNLLWLNQRINTSPDNYQINAFLNLDFDKSTYGQLLAHCKAMQLDNSLVPYLVFNGTLKTNWLKLIDDDSKVWR